MADIKKQSSESRDYKERFEFVLTTGGNIICQRYFRINNFNPASLRSYELTNAIRKCVASIDRDLKDKTQTYLEIYAPKTFNTVDEMEAFVSNPENADRLTIGEGFVVRRNSKTDYFLDKNKSIKELGSKFDDGEITENDAETNKTTYRFSFRVDGRDVCSMEWDGYYPKFVRDKIDLSNKRGKFEGEDVDRLSYEQWLLYKMVQGKSDLVYGLIKNICYACSNPDTKGNETVDEIIDSWNFDSQKNLWDAL